MKKHYWWILAAVVAYVWWSNQAATSATTNAAPGVTSAPATNVVSISSAGNSGNGPGIAIATLPISLIGGDPTAY
jgi:hypothetical protein